ncbi:MAG: zinc-ribbon domain-containing protein [Sphingomicrobium sp.]
MILTCPSCTTQYVVKDGAIPPGGRQVRCASCKHSWHQDEEFSDGQPGPLERAAADEPAIADVHPEASDEYSEAEVGNAAAVDKEPDEDDSESLVEATLIEPRAGPEAEQRAYEEALIDDQLLATPETDGFGEWPSAERPDAGLDRETGAAREANFSPFAMVDQDEPPRRGPLIALITIVLLAIAAAALFWFVAPNSWKSRIGLSTAAASPLKLVYQTDRQTLESGNVLLTVTGRIINPTDQEQLVPPLQAQVTSAAGENVRTWPIAPPAQSLPPGGSASFNSAEMNVLEGAEITLRFSTLKA